MGSLIAWVLSYALSRADNADELNKLLSMPAAHRLHTQKEFKEASEANRVQQDELAKASAERAAADAR